MVDKEVELRYEKSPLPYSVDALAIDKLYRETVFEFWKKKGLL